MSGRLKGNRGRKRGKKPYGPATSLKIGFRRARIRTSRLIEWISEVFRCLAQKRAGAEAESERLDASSSSSRDHSLTRPEVFQTDKGVQKCTGIAQQSPLVLSISYRTKVEDRFGRQVELASSPPSFVPSLSLSSTVHCPRNHVPAIFGRPFRLLPSSRTPPLHLLLLLSFHPRFPHSNQLHLPRARFLLPLPVRSSRRSVLSSQILWEESWKRTQSIHR